MKNLTLISWNVNGIRAVANKKIFEGKNFYEWVRNYSPDVLCLQETKADPTQLPTSLRDLPSYHSYWNSAEKKGYSGVVTYSRSRAQSINLEFNDEILNNEGRIVETQFKNFLLFNVYFPNGKQSEERLQYKMNFYEKFLCYVEKRRKEGNSIIICGDVNTAHREIDLARPKDNETISGFLPIEREWIDKFLAHGYIDTFRHLNKDKVTYSWWSMRTRARDRNVGWRIDYFYVSSDLKDKIEDAFILNEVEGSDHCPIGITINIT